MGLHKKTTLIIFLAVLTAIIAGILFQANRTLAPEPLSGDISAQALTGEVVSVDVAPWAYDGSAVVVVRDSMSNNLVNIQVPARLNLCAAQSSITDISQLQPGDHVAFQGDAVNENNENITVCDSGTYLRRQSKRSPIAETTSPSVPVDESTITTSPAMGSITVGLGETSEVDGFVITPTAVIEDSRCPANVDCIWQGRLVVEVMVSVGDEVQALELELGKTTKTYFGKSILLQSATIGPDYEFGFWLVNDIE